jgi:hypothetical protein
MDIRFGTQYTINAKPLSQEQLGHVKQAYRQTNPPNGIFTPPEDSPNKDQVIVQFFGPDLESDAPEHEEKFEQLLREQGIYDATTVVAKSNSEAPNENLGLMLALRNMLKRD